MCDIPSSTNRLRPLTRRLLVVEDHADSLRALVRLFTLDGYEVLPAASVKQAIDQLTLEPALVVTDLMLPDGSGLDVLRRARAHEGSIPVAIYTAADHERTRQAGEAGANAIFHKPGGMPELRRWMRANS